MRLAQDIAFGFQDAESLAHRRNAQLELFGDIGLFQPCAARQAAGKYAFAQELGDVFLFCFEVHG